MLFASTKATLKNEFGSGRIKEEMHVTQLDEITLEGYKTLKKEIASPAPLTSREEEIERMKKNENKIEFNVSSKQQSLGGIIFPLEQACVLALDDFTNKIYNYLQFKIHLDEEKICLAKAMNIKANNISTEVPKDQARYHLFLFDHTHEGDFQQALIFIYTISEQSCSIKERMLYSSCKAPLIETLKQYGLDIVKTIEVSNDDVLNEEFIMDCVHPKTTVYRQLFAKPKGPINRGPKRLTRTVIQDEQ